MKELLIKEIEQSTLKQLPLGRLKELEVPVPPIERQEQFATFVEQADKSKVVIMHASKLLNMLELM